jgi:4-amino-4-deoxy-L-arabinose transferase-like glycosyltransferase
LIESKARLVIASDQRCFHEKNIPNHANAGSKSPPVAGITPWREQVYNGERLWSRRVAETGSTDMQNTPILTNRSESSSHASSILTASIWKVSEKTERLAPYLAAIILIIVLRCGIVKGLYKPLWFDELFSTFISRLPHPAEFWSFAKAVPDGQPPFYYYVVSASMHLLHNEPLGLRMPSIIGYVVFCASLYIFVSRMTSRIYGLAALMLPNITGCWYYLTEGRPYGLVLGFTGLAAVAWQSVTINRSRKFALMGLALSLSGAFAFHYFSVLLLAPFAVAEAARSISRRKLDLPVWLALAVPCLLLIVLVPVARQTRANSGVPTYWFATPAWYRSLDEFGNQFFGQTIVPLVVIACIYIAWQHFATVQDGRIEREEALRTTRLAAEIPLVLALAGLPVLGIAVGKFATHYFYPRYVIEAMFGMAVLILLVLWRAFSGRKDAGLIVLVVFCVVFGRTALGDFRQAESDRVVPIRQMMQSRIPAIARNDQLPIAVTDGFTFMELSYYGDSALLNRMCYLSSLEYELKYFGANTGAHANIQAAPYFGTQVVDYRKWTNNHRTFYLLAGMGSFAIAQLIRDGAQLQLLQGGPIDTLGHTADPFFLVSFPGN